MQSVDPQDALLSRMHFAESTRPSFVTYLKVTSRTSKMLCDATASLAWTVFPEHKTFNNHVSEVVKVLFGRPRSMTQGRLPDSVSSMCKFIRATILDACKDSCSFPGQAASKHRISWELLCCMFFLEGLHGFSKWQEAFF